MIVYKQWETSKTRSIYRIHTTWEGWWLFGIVPLYIRQVSQQKYVR